MDSKAITQILQLYMMNNVTTGNTGTTNPQNTQVADMFNLMLQEMLNNVAKDNSSDIISQNTIPGVDINNIKINNNMVSYNSSDGDTKNEINNIIENTAQKYGVDGNFIKAIVGQESSFNPQAVSKAGAMGLMQLMPKTSESLGVKNPFDVLENIDGGTRYIKKLIDSFGGNKELALSAYNGGISRMNKRSVDTIEEINKMPMETQNYVDKVMKKYESYKKG